MSGMPPESGTPVLPAPIPWEQPGYPAGKGLIETIQLFFMRPHEGYGRMPTTPDLVRPLLYYIGIGWLAMAISQVYDLAFKSVFPSMWGDKLSELGFAGGGVFGSVVLIVIAPLVLLVWLFIWTAIVHLFLMMLGGATAGFLTTCRVICYAGTTNLLSLVPVCGGLVGAIWGLVLEIIGLSVAHKTSYGKAALAVLLPLLLCCACVVVGAVFMGAGIMSLLKSQ